MDPGVRPDNWSMITRLDEYIPFDFNELNYDTCNYVIHMGYMGSSYMSKKGDKYYIFHMSWGERWNSTDGKTYTLEYGIDNFLTKDVFEGLIKDIENFHQQIRLLETK